MCKRIMQRNQKISSSSNNCQIFLVKLWRYAGTKFSTLSMSGFVQYAIGTISFMANCFRYGISIIWPGGKLRTLSCQRCWTSWGTVPVFASFLRCCLSRGALALCNFYLGATQRDWCVLLAGTSCLYDDWKFCSK